MKKVYIFYNGPTPPGVAGSIRFSNLSLIFNKLGYDVYMVGYDENGERQYDYKGMHCFVMDPVLSTGFFAMQKREEKRLRFVQKFLDENEVPDLVVSGCRNCKAKRFLMSWCKRNRIPIIEDVVEWYDKNNFPGIKGFLKFLNDRYFMHIQAPKQKNIIGISTLLCDYYASRGCNTVYIPTLVDMEEYKEAIHHESGGPLKVAYAGSPVKKDYIANAVRAMGLLSEEERKKISLHLYGASEDQIVALGIERAFLEQNRECVVCHGRIPYAEVKTKISDADFTVLLRPDKRYANAGFPTKVGESMACGTPVIANHTSNLDRYVLDGSTGFVCKDETPEACSEAFRRAIAASPEKRQLMRESALQMANTGFEYSNYLKDMESFLCRIK